MSIDSGDFIRKNWAVIVFFGTLVFYAGSTWHKIIKLDEVVKSYITSYEAEGKDLDRRVKELELQVQSLQSKQDLILGNQGSILRKLD